MSIGFFISRKTGRKVEVEFSQTSTSVKFTDLWDDERGFLINNDDIQAMIEALTYAKDHTTP